MLKPDLSNTRIVVVDYGASNLRSIVASIRRLTSSVLVISGRDEPPVVYGATVTKSVDEVQMYEPTHLILPGVGSFSTAMRCLERSELLKMIKEFHAMRLPVLGICLGMQLLFESGEEGTSGVRPGIGLLQGTVQNLRKLGVQARYVPNIGWSSGSTETGLQGDQFELFCTEDMYFYCHEYGIRANECQTMEIKHVLELPGVNQPARILSGFVSKNLTGVQFHPERSGTTGERFLRTWVMGKESKR